MQKKKNYFLGLTLLELLIVLVIMGIFARGIFASWDTFGWYRDVEVSIQKLYYDLGLTWKFARTLRNGYSYYGLRFYNNTGSDGKQYGYKLLHFYNASGVGDPPILPINNTTSFEVIKSSQIADNPEFLDNAFFAKGVVIDSASELKAGDTLVFTPQGSATSDGLNLLNSTKDTVTLRKGNSRQGLKIYNMTGLTEIVKY